MLYEWQQAKFLESGKPGRLTGELHIDLMDSNAKALFVSILLTRTELAANPITSRLYFRQNNGK